MSCSKTCIISRLYITIPTEKLIWPDPKKVVNFVTIEDIPENLPKQDNVDIKGINKILIELYKKIYEETPFKVKLDRALYLRVSYSKSQELAEAANKKKEKWPIEEIVPRYLYKRFLKIFS